MKKGTDWEDYVHHVYSTLLNLKGERIQVSKRTTFVVPSGETYEIDVYYEFWKAGVRHRVAIECKDWKNPVSQGQILEFHQKIKNIGNDLVGVVVARNGYQEGALKVAERHGVLALSEASIPSISQLLGQRITTSLIHEPNLIGEPFWCIAELDGDAGSESNGVYCATPPGLPFNVPLFVSKRHAQAYRHSLPDADKFGVFGLPQYKLRALIALANLDRIKFAIVYGAPDLSGKVMALPTMGGNALKEDFLLMSHDAEL